MTQKRGRKSAAEIEVVSPVVRLGDRPEPPMSLNDRAVDEWRRVVNRMPSDWFTDETLSLLQAFCEHVAEGEALQLMIEKVRCKAMTDDECFARYRQLCTMKETQTRAALSCATKMRMTQQSSYTDKASSTAKQSSAGGRKPWDN